MTHPVVEIIENNKEFKGFNVKVFRLTLKNRYLADHMQKHMVEPYFHFSCPVSALNKLQKLQNRAARIVTNSPYRSSAAPIIRQLGWQTVIDLVETETLKMVHRSLNHKAPNYLTGLFQRLSETRKVRNTSTDLFVPLIKTACGQNASHMEKSKF